MSELSIERFAHTALLFDFYGCLLTKRQSDIFEMHYMKDLSLSEIGEELGITRQAACILIGRVMKTLEKYEQKLGLIEKHFCMLKRCREASLSLKLIIEGGEMSDEVRSKLKEILKCFPED